jgi:hypothetical protein
MNSQIVEDKMAAVTTIFLASIYDKSEAENISDKDLERLIEEIQDLLED